MQSTTSTADYVIKFINQTTKSLFLTGNAGTGKTTLLRKILETTHKNTVVVAPTGIAALNAGGVTIHSMFQLPFSAYIPISQTEPLFRNGQKFETTGSIKRHFRMSAVKQSVIKNMDLLIIDEVSMLRADVLDAINMALQITRKNQQPFGGLQVLFIGDLLQLPPVIKNDEWEVLKNFYSGKFFFHSKVIQTTPVLYIELTKIYRQNDADFINVLNNLRNNVVTESDLKILNQYYKPDFNPENDNHITLTTHNAKADAINLRAIGTLSSDEQQFTAEITGDFPEKIYPVDEILCLKEGARVMFIKNDLSSDKNYFNGKTGIVNYLSEAEVHVKFEDGSIIEVDKYEWSNIRYYVDSQTSELKEEVLGTFVQYPLKLAWAITVHKSQGLTFDKVALDVSQVFQPGQAYVALSRLTSLDGLVLLAPLNMNGIENDQDVMNFASNKTDGNSLDHELQTQTRMYVHQVVRQAFDLKNLADNWQKLSNEYAQTNKNNLGSFLKDNSDRISDLADFALKFQSQINALFSNSDLDSIQNRFLAAFNFFFGRLEHSLVDLLVQSELVRRSKKSKGLQADLFNLEQIHVNVLLKLLKAKKILEVYVNGQEISRENIATLESSKYRSQVYDKARELFTNTASALIDDEQSFKPKKVKKEPKKSTIIETFELWQQKNSIKEIAEIRKLTTSTIANHLAKLIQANQVLLTDILPDDRIQKLREVFIGHQEEETLSELKQQVGDSFTWDELRLYKAAIFNSANKQQELQE